MAHTLVAGMTESGKTTLLLILTRGIKAAGRNVAVLDPMLDPRWEADFITADPQEFLEFARSNKEYVLVVDESGSAIGRYNEAMNWLATTSRHLGHSAYFLLQGTTQVDPIIRGNCSECFLFACYQTVVDMIIREYNCPEIMGANKMKPGEFFLVGRFVEPMRGKVDFSDQSVTMATLAEWSESPENPEPEPKNDDETDDNNGSDNDTADSGVNNTV